MQWPPALWAWPLRTALADLETGNAQSLVAEAKALPDVLPASNAARAVPDVPAERSSGIVMDDAVPSAYTVSYSILPRTNRSVCMATVGSWDGETDICGSRSPFSWRIETTCGDYRSVRRNGAACWTHMPKRKRAIALMLGVVEPQIIKEPEKGAVA